MAWLLLIPAGLAFRYLIIIPLALGEIAVVWALLSYLDIVPTISWALIQQPSQRDLLWFIAIAAVMNVSIPKTS
jgi:hypothetical protein